MYVIGVSDWRLIKIIKMEALYDGKDMWSEVKSIEYDASLADQATIFSDIEKAKVILKYIKNNTENIQFTNNNSICQVLNEDSEFDEISYTKYNGFDKLSYVNDLKIFKLIPVLADYEND